MVDGKHFKSALTLRHLRIIAALSELGLVARVAEMLGVTQPAVSKQIAELENLVGVPIVARDRNRLHLTAVGRRLAEHARQVLNQVDRAAFDVTAMASGVSGAVSIGAVSSVSPTLLPAAITLFKRSAPATSVSVTEGHFISLFPQLEAGTIDLLIARIWHPQELPGIEQMVLFREPVVVVAGVDHPLARNPAPQWADLADNLWILPQAESVARRALDAFFAGNGLGTPENTIASVSLTLNLEILRRMPALGVFPQGLAQRHALRGDLVVLPLDIDGLLSEARCFWRRDQFETNGTAELFLNCLRQTTSQL
ncbi:LysR family transcriptional regulator [Stappia sp.]|uniref:LysR family transcriptional regulator n=1 Tax=Stappia sp. TaxID=1870903 RepID=UPI003A98ECF6